MKRKLGGQPPAQGAALTQKARGLAPGFLKSHLHKNTRRPNSTGEAHASAPASLEGRRLEMPRKVARSALVRFLGLDGGFRRGRGLGFDFSRGHIFFERGLDLV